MSRVFVSYRHSGGHDDAMWVRDRLIACLGDRNVFLDDDIAPGSRWREAIDDGLDRADTLLVLIDESWLRHPAHAGSDEVVREVGYFLGNRSAKVVPVLLGEAAMPPSSRLPAPLEPLADIQALRITGRDRQADFDILNDRLELKCRRAWVRPALIALGIVAVAAIVGWAMWLLWLAGDDGDVIVVVANMSVEKSDGGTTLIAQGGGEGFHAFRVTRAIDVEMRFRTCEGDVTVSVGDLGTTEFEECEAGDVEVVSLPAADEYDLRVTSRGVYVLAVSEGGTVGAAGTTAPTPVTAATSAPRATDQTAVTGVTSTAGTTAPPVNEPPGRVVGSGLFETVRGIGTTYVARGEVESPSAHQLSVDSATEVFAEVRVAGWECGANVDLVVSLSGIETQRIDLASCPVPSTPGFLEFQQGGSYEITIEGHGASGEYEFSLYQPTRIGGRLGPGERHSHDFEVLGDGRTLYVHLRECAGGAEWMLTGATGTVEVNSCTFGPGSFDRVLNSGGHTISVVAGGGGLTYGADLWDSRTERHDDPLPLDGSEVQGGFGPGSSDQYVIELNAPTRLDLELTVAACRAEHFDGGQWRWALQGRVERMLVRACIAGGDPGDFGLGVLPAGRYTLSLAGVGGTHGTYTFRLCEGACEG